MTDEKKKKKKEGDDGVDSPVQHDPRFEDAFIKSSGDYFKKHEPDFHALLQRVKKP